ncbi:sphingomyelin phosphodiesterase 4-like isoform X1 [Mytilus californianus]|uniref:sphingomyelin phosphodiesterase 4-like isoform X1 n=1 Tax=Mytilus californianus TaxID=6549 RepID=UPI002245A5E9|nr:sphingomyelin phosphodiesterase 4-like isoform X1 [Mytilus californianus]
MEMTTTGNSVLSRLQLAYSRPLLQRCNEIENIIHSAGTQELKNALPSILSNIFGYGSEVGWQLHSISRGYNLQEFECARRFLGSEGPLLTLVYNLQTDVSLLYEFPLHHIPGPSRQIIEEGNIPYFYINKLQTQGYGSHLILLSAFEYYMFHFAHCLLNWQNLAWNNLTDNLFPCLLDDYLNYFLPLNKSTLPPVPHQQSPIRSPVIHSKMYSPGGKTNTSPRTFGLLKASFIASQKQHSQNSSVLGQSEAEVWRSETLLQIFIEFWLNQNAIDSDRSMISPTHMYMSHQYIFSHLTEHFMPSLEHVRLVRMMIKHVHHFVNTASQDIIPSPYQTHPMSPLDEFKRSIIPNMLQKSMYAFLRHSFDRWPLDNSFRMVLETWLTYIQPWRYTSKLPSTRRDSEGDTKLVEEKWFTFIEDNLLFYSVLLQEFFNRVKRMDLMNLANSHMLYRVAKVFRLENLDSMLRQAEQEMCTSIYRSSGHMTRDLGGSYLSPESSLMFHSQISDLEKPGFQYTLMFGEKTLYSVKQVLQQLQQVKTQIQYQQGSKPVRSGLAGFFSGLFDDNSVAVGDLTPNDVKKLHKFLDDCIKNLCFIYDLPETKYITTNTVQDSSYYGNISYNTDLDNTCPDMTETCNGVSLTDIGRYQVINKMKRFEVMYSGDPDLQPIRSFENATTVRLLHQFCSYINTQFSNEIQTVYERRDLIGRLAQVYFAPALPRDKKPSSPISGKNLEELQRPKLRLRFLASYSTMLYLAILFVFLNVWLGVGPGQYLLLLLACTLFFGLLRALVISS